MVLESDAGGELHVHSPNFGVGFSAKSSLMSWGILGLILGAVGGFAGGGGILGFLGGGLVTGVVYGAFGALAGALYGLFVGNVLSARQLKKLDCLFPRTARWRLCGRTATSPTRPSIDGRRPGRSGWLFGSTYFTRHRLGCLGGCSHRSTRSRTGSPPRGGRSVHFCSDHRLADSTEPVKTHSRRRPSVRPTAPADSTRRGYCLASASTSRATYPGGNAGTPDRSPVVALASTADVLTGERTIVDV